MRKQVINNEQEKLSIVILSNDSYGILAKGISRCHPDDNYDPEIGEKIANSRAWIKYYDKLKRFADRELEWVEDMEQHYAKRVNEYKDLRENATNKYNEIIADYNETLKNL